VRRQLDLSRPFSHSDTRQRCKRTTRSEGPHPAGENGSRCARSETWARGLQREIRRHPREHCAMGRGRGRVRT
jgi:hypothetical protein